MPDWISHMLIALIIYEVFRFEKKSLVILGALLPDMLGKLSLLVNVFELPYDVLYWIFTPFHTPLGCVLITFLIVHFFRYNQRKAFLYITAGWVSHLPFDLVNKHMLLGQNMLLFPVSWTNFRIGFAWPERFYLSLVPLIIVYLIILSVKRKKNQNVYKTR